MKFFIDTANIDEIRDASAAGLVDGVTTNPSLIAQTGRKFEEVIKDIVEVVDGPISAEVVSTEHEAMVAEGRTVAKIHPNIVVKVPLTIDGLKATRTLSSEGTRVNVTLCFSPSQALLAAKAGATYISPFVGRVDDISIDGMQLIDDILTIYGNYGFDTEVLVASVRHPNHVLQAARMGADICTVPHKVLMQLAKHPLTESGLERFLKDWEDVPK